MVTFVKMYASMVLYNMNIYDHVVAVIICILAPVLAFTSRRIVSEDITLESEDKIRLYHSNGLLLIVFALIVTTMWRVPGRPLTGLGIDFVTWHPAIPLLVLGIFIFYFLDMFFQYGVKRWREQTLKRRHKAMTFIPANGKELSHFIFLSVAAGIGEEIIFRGFLINYLLHWTGNDTIGIVVACIFSSALFAFLHGYQGMRSMIKIFILAMLFSAIFVFSKSLLIVIFIHAIIDIISGLVGIFVLRNTEQKSE